MHRHQPSRVAALFLGFILLFANTLPGQAADRVALVIGNGGYQKVPALPNPPRDAEDMAHALERLGFAVTLLKDADLDRTRAALSDFGAQAANAGMAVVFYAGHGIEAGGENWLIPVDATIASNADAQTKAIGLHAVMQLVNRATTLGLVILDACRDNPFIAPAAEARPAATASRAEATRSIAKGLAPVDPVGNVLVAFSAKDGTVANDGDGRNSPFTSALLRHIEAEGVEVTFLFRMVRDDVIAATAGTQQPYLYGSLPKESIYLRQPTSDQRLAVMPPIPPATREPNALFGEQDKLKVASIAEARQIAVPIYQIDTIDPAVPANLRRFVGAWISKIGTNGGRGRQVMLIITTVDATGILSGFWAWGQPNERTWTKNPPGFTGIRSAVRGSIFEFDIGGGRQHQTFELLSDGRMNVVAQRNGQTGTNVLYPVWMLAAREQGKQLTAFDEPAKNAPNNAKQRSAPAR